MEGTPERSGRGAQAVYAGLVLDRGLELQPPTATKLSEEPDLKRRTYAAAARAIKEACRIQRLSPPNVSPVERMHGLIGYDS
jgi:hypothetical protein